MPNDDYCFLAQVGYLPETYILGLFANYLNDYINNVYILSHWKGGFKYLTDFYLDTVHCIFVNCKSNIPMRKKHTVFLENWNTKNWKQEHHKLRAFFYLKKTSVDTAQYIFQEWSKGKMLVSEIEL